MNEYIINENVKKYFSQASYIFIFFLVSMSYNEIISKIIEKLQFFQDL